MWKYLFELASKDLEALKKKRQALGDLLSSNKISQQTYEYLNKDLSEAMRSTEKYLESLVSKMKSRVDDLEKQIGILEIFLANSEMMYAAGEIDYETYDKESRALVAGIESMRREIFEIKNILGAPAPEHAAAPSENITSIVVEAKNTEETFEQT